MGKVESRFSDSMVWLAKEFVSAGCLFCTQNINRLVSTFSVDVSPVIPSIHHSEIVPLNNPSRLLCVYIRWNWYFGSLSTRKTSIQWCQSRWRWNLLGLTFRSFRIEDICSVVLPHYNDTCAPYCWDGSPGRFNSGTTIVQRSHCKIEM